MSAPSSASRTSSCGEVEALDRRVVDLAGDQSSATGSAGEVADGDADVLVADVEADRERGVGDEREEDRGRPVIRGPRLVGRAVLLDDAGPAELLDRAVETVARESPCGRASSARLGRRTAVERLDHAQPVHLPGSEYVCVS